MKYSIILAVILTISLQACENKDASVSAVTPVSKAEKSGVALPVGPYKSPFALSGNRQLVQRFRATQNGLGAIQVTMVTFGTVPADYQVAWQLKDIHEGAGVLIASGTFASKDAVDWNVLRLALPSAIANSNGRLYELDLKAMGATDPRVIGLPLYSMIEGEKNLEPITTPSESSSERLALRLLLEYAP